MTQSLHESTYYVSIIIIIIIIIIDSSIQMRLRDTCRFRTA